MLLSAWYIDFTIHENSRTYLLVVARQRWVTTAVTIHFCLKALTPIGFTTFGSTIAFCESLSPTSWLFGNCFTEWQCLVLSHICFCKKFLWRQWCPFKTPSLTDISYISLFLIVTREQPKDIPGVSTAPVIKWYKHSNIVSNLTGLMVNSTALNYDWLACARFAPTRCWWILSSLFITDAHLTGVGGRDVENGARFSAGRMSHGVNAQRPHSMPLLQKRSLAEHDVWHLLLGLAVQSAWMAECQAGWLAGYQAGGWEGVRLDGWQAVGLGGWQGVRLSG